MSETKQAKKAKQWSRHFKLAQNGSEDTRRCWDEASLYEQRASCSQVWVKTAHSKYENRQSTRQRGKPACFYFEGLMTFSKAKVISLAISPQKLRHLMEVLITVLTKKAPCNVSTSSRSRRVGAGGQFTLK